MQRANSVKNLNVYTNLSGNTAPQGGGGAFASGNRAHSSRQAQQQHRTQQTAKLRGPLYSNVTNGSVVIDIGTRTVKVGIVGDVAPTLVMKTPARLSQLLLLGSSIQRAGGVLPSPQQEAAESKETFLMREKKGKNDCVAVVVLPTEVEQLITTTSTATTSALALAGKGSFSALSSAAQNEVRSTESLRLIAAGGTEVLVGIGGQSQNGEEGVGVTKRCYGRDDSSNTTKSVAVSTDSGGMYEEEVSALMTMISARVPLIGSTKTPIFLQDIDCNPQLAAAVKVWLGTHTDPLGKMTATTSYSSFIENAHNYQPDLSLTTATTNPAREDDESGTSTNPSPMALSRAASLRRIGIISANRSAYGGVGGGGANNEETAAASNSSPCNLNTTTGTFYGDCVAAAAAPSPTTTANTMMSFSLQAINQTNLANGANTDTSFGAAAAARLLPIPTAPIDGVAFFSGNINPVVGARGGNNQHSGNNPRSKFSINNYVSMKHGLGLGGGKGVALTDLSAEIDEDAQGLKDLHQMSGREVSGLDITTYYPSSTFGKQPQVTRTVSLSSPAIALNSGIDDLPLGSSSGPKTTSGVGGGSGKGTTYKDPLHYQQVDELSDTFVSSPNGTTSILKTNTPLPPLPKSDKTTDNNILIDVRKELETCLSLTQHSGGTATSSLSAGVGSGGGGGGLGAFKSSSNLRAALAGVSSGGLLGDGGTTTNYEERARAMSEFSPITVAAAGGNPQHTQSPNFGNMLASQQNQNAASVGVVAAAAAAQTSSLAPITPSQKRALVQIPSPSTTVSHYYAHGIEKTQTPSSPTTSNGFEKTKNGEEATTAAVNCGAPESSQQLSLSPTIHLNPVISHNIFSKPANAVLTLSLQASALASYGLRSGLVLDLGWKSSRVVPIIHNVCDKRLAATPCYWGLRNVIHILRRQIMEENFSSNSSKSSGRLLEQSEALLTDDLLHDFILQYGVVAPPVGHPKRDAILEAKYPIVLKTNIVYGKPNLALEVLFTGCVVLPPSSWNAQSSHAFDGSSSSPSRSMSVFGSPLIRQQQQQTSSVAASNSGANEELSANNNDNNNKDALFRLVIGSAASEIIQSLQKMSASASPASASSPATPQTPATKSNGTTTTTNTSGVVDPLATTPYTTFLDTLVTSGLRRSGDEVSAGPRAHLLLLEHLEKVKELKNVTASERQNEEGRKEVSTLSLETPTFRGGIVLHIFEALLRCHPWFNLAEAGSVLVLTGCMASIPNLYKRLASVLAELSGKYMLRKEHLESELIAPYANHLGAKLAIDFNIRSNTGNQHVAIEEKQKRAEEKERFMKQYPLPAVSKLDYISVFAKAELCDDVLSHAMSTMMTSNADGGEGGSHPANLGGSDAASGAGYAYKLALEHLYLESVRKKYSFSSSSSTSIAGAAAAAAAAAESEPAHKNISEAIKNMSSHDIVREISVASASAALHRMTNAKTGGLEPTISPFGLKMVLAVAETRVRDVLKTMKIIPPSITPQQAMTTAAAERNGASSSSTTTTATRRPPSSSNTTVSCLITSKEYPCLAGGRLLPSAAAIFGAMTVYGTN